MNWKFKNLIIFKYLKFVDCDEDLKKILGVLKLVLVLNYVYVYIDWN